MDKENKEYVCSALKVATLVVPEVEQTYQCLRKEPLCFAWCRLPRRLPLYLVQFLMSCLAVVKRMNTF